MLTNNSYDSNTIYWTNSHIKRDSLTDYETVRQVTLWYEMLAQDLVGGDEEVECPECGKKCEGRESYRIHSTQNCDNENFSGSLFYSESQIHEEIASNTPYGKRTVSNLVNVGQLPDEVLWLLKTPDERTKSEQEQVRNKLFGRCY